LFNVLGRVPVEGESVEVDGLRLVAERVEGNRIGRIRVVPLAAGAPPPTSGGDGSVAGD
jgi:CBS domain containing-hemolysin-like protein